jgi:hypothetical protein
MGNGAWGMGHGHGAWAWGMERVSHTIMHKGLTDVNNVLLNSQFPMPIAQCPIPSKITWHCRTSTG